jgi:putative transcriptional regulator
MERHILFRGRTVLSVPSEIDVRALRERLGMTQNLFAARFGFPLATLRHWEYGQRHPTGASLTLLNVIAHNPRAVMQALRAPLGAGLRPIEEYTALADALSAIEEKLRREPRNAVFCERDPEDPKTDPPDPF